MKESLTHSIHKRKSTDDIQNLSIKKISTLFRNMEMHIRTEGCLPLGAR